MERAGDGVHSPISFVPYGNRITNSGVGFYMNLPLGGATGVLLFFAPIPDPRIQSEVKQTFWQSMQQLDPFGALTFTPAIIMCLLALEWGGTTYNWNSATILGLLCGSCATFCIFVFSQYRNREHAMIPLKMLSRRIVYYSFLTVVFQRGGLFLLIYYMPFWFQAVKGAAPTLSGVYILPTVLSQIIAAMGAGWAGKSLPIFWNYLKLTSLVGRSGYYLPWAIAGSFLTSCGSGLMSKILFPRYKTDNLPLTSLQVCSPHQAAPQFGSTSRSSSVLAEA
jgi:hypothetical protein